MELNTFLLVMIILLLMIYCPRGSENIFRSRSQVASVCTGQQLTLTCRANHSNTLKWVIVPNNNDPKAEGNIQSRLVSFEGNSILRSLNVAGVIFNITRTSEENRLPLRSELLIDGVTVDMNGTEVHCSPLNISDNNITFIVDVLGANSVLHPLKVDKAGYRFDSTNFTAILNWTQEGGVSYNISINPITELIHLMNNTWQVIGYYNTVYNVSIVATLCEEYSKTTNITLEYATCEFLTIEYLGIIDPMLRINNIGSRNPAIKGDTVTFYCPSGGELMGQNRTTCLGNGKWEPEPMATCKQVPNSATCGPPSQPILGYILANMNTSVTFVCQNQTQLHPETIVTATCNNGVWEPDPRNHCTSTDSKSKGKLNGALVGGVLGSLFVAAIVILAVVLIIVILLKKGCISFKKLCRRAPKENMYCTVSDQLPVENQNSTDQAETIMYADIGPSSFQKIPHIILGPDDDDHVEYAQVNQTLLTVKEEETKQKMETSFIDDSLNLDTLLIQIKAAVTSRWYQLGEALGIDKESLDRYSSHSPEDSIVEMLDQWLRSGPQRRTWRDVADALRRIDLQQLAINVEKVYETGKLPITVNMNDIPQNPLPPKLTELPPPLPSKMKPNSSDSNLISRHKRTLPPRTKQNSDSTLVNNQREVHNCTLYTRDRSPLQLVQEITLTAPTLDSDLMSPPLPPKPTAVSDACIDVAVPSRPPKN